MNLDGVKRPGNSDFYNRATTKQRMLESILQTADPAADIGNGMNLVQSLHLIQQGIPVLLPSDLNYISDNMRIYTNTADKNSRIAQLALARAYEASANVNPATDSEKLRTWRYTSMLLSVTSSMRNFMGNGLTNVLNAFAHDIIAANADKLIAKKTGVHTIAAISSEERANGWKQFKQEMRNTWNDYFVDKAITRPEGVKYSPTNRGRVFQEGILGTGNVAEAMRLAEGYLMSLGDRNFWAMAYSNSMAEQKRLAEMNGVEFDAEAAAEKAAKDADYAIFNEDNKSKTGLRMASALLLSALSWS